MAKPKSPSELLAVSREVLERYEAVVPSTAEDARPPSLGDVYVLEETREPGIEWVIVAHDPADPERFLAVPADGNFLAGSSDFELPASSPAGALTLRCRFATWIDVRFLKSELRVGVLGSSEVVGARQKWLEVGDGEVTGPALAREVDDDPEYQDWVDGVLAVARRALMEAQALEGSPDVAAAVEELKDEPVAPAWRSQGSMFFRIAASIIVAVASVQLWRLNERLHDLETTSRSAKERHEVVVRQFETERDSLTAERDRLLVRQEELEAAGLENEEEVIALLQRVVVLDQRLKDAERPPVIVNPAIVLFENPRETRGGKRVITIRPEQNYVVVFLRLLEASQAPRYQLLVRLKGTSTSIWTNDRLVVQEPSEIRAGLPVEILKQGRYELELVALDSGTTRRIAEYELVVIEDSSPPKRRGAS